MGDTSTGSIIGDKYRLGPVLGRGGMGVVREASHVRLGTKFAVKLLHEASDQLDRSRFEREALAASSLHNRHVVRVFDIGETADGTPYMVMELLRGRDVMAAYRSEEPLATTRIVDWMIQVCSAMHEAHGAGIVHRDLKPSNLFLAEAGNQELVKVVDFGISKVLSAKELTVQSSFVGTPQYMAPEQLRGESTIDHRADLWAMGVITYRLLSRQYPFTMAEDVSPIVAALANLTATPTPLSAHRPDLAPELVEVVMRALARERADRFADAREMALALAPHGSGAVTFEEPGESRPSDLLDRLQESHAMFTTPLTLTATEPATVEVVLEAPDRRRPGVAALALGGLLVLVAVGAVLATRSPSAARSLATPSTQALEPDRETNGAGTPPLVVPSASNPAEPVLLPAGSIPVASAPPAAPRPVKPTKPSSLPTHL